jgi:hypothetical protein
MVESLPKLLDRCRELLGPAPRELRWEEQQFWQLRVSFFRRFIFWLILDNLRMILRHQNLGDHGRVARGHLVEQNKYQFSPVKGQVFYNCRSKNGTFIFSDLQDRKKLDVPFAFPTRVLRPMS